MADFCKYGYTIAEALGVGGDKFLDAYNINTKWHIQGSSLAQSVIQLMDDESLWEGTMGEAYKELKDSIIDYTRDDHTFPKHSNQLKKALERNQDKFAGSGHQF